MRLIPSDPDVETILSRIRNDDIDLQPNFQRGEVWSVSKKQKLIDSILRNWHVPPIHVIEDTKTGKSEVLDGQQRLVTLRDFAAGVFSIDATIEPTVPEFRDLHKKRYAELGPEWKRKFHKFSIRMFSIVDYRPSEPSELFYRLNQPVALTSAEQRNAFFGRPREQVKTLVSEMERKGVDKKILGFSNSRMAYDDVIARFCFLLDKGRLNEKVSAQALADRYRTGEGFSNAVIDTAQRSLQLFVHRKEMIGGQFQLNKASLLSWLLFFARGLHRSRPFHSEQVFAFLHKFERERTDSISDLSFLLSIYNDRVTSRVSDVSSVVYRDLVLWIQWLEYALKNGVHLKLTGGPEQLAESLGADSGVIYQGFPDTPVESRLEGLFAKIGTWERFP